MKYYCSTNKNITIGWVLVQAANLLIVEEKRLTGLLGNEVSRFYRLDRKHSCRFVSFDTIGTRLTNGSYTGVLGALKDKKIDAYGRPSAVHLYEDFMRIPVASNQGSLKTGHMVKNEMKSKSGSLHMFDIEIWLRLFPVLAFLLTFILLFQLINVSNAKKKAGLIGSCLFEIDFHLTKSINVVSMIALFYLIYFRIFKSIVSNNIKTNSVVVDTSEIIDNQNDLLNTKKPICYWRNQFDFQLSKSAPKGSFLAKVLEKSKRNHNNTICASSSNNFLIKIDLKKSIFFSEETAILSAALIMANIFQNIQYYFSKNSFFNIVYVTLFKKDIDKEFSNIPQQILESGLGEKLQADIRSVLKSGFERRVRLFTSKQEFIDEFSKSSSLNLDYFRDLFELFLILNLVIISLFVLNCIFRRFEADFLKIVCYIVRCCSYLKIVQKIIKSVNLIKSHHMIHTKFTAPKKI